jgi:hypothetical protein
LGKSFGASIQDNHLSNVKFLLNVCTKLLWVISSDRFADYGSSEVVAPGIKLPSHQIVTFEKIIDFFIQVRETASMALGVIFELLPKTRSEWIVSMLLKMLKVCF